MRTPATNTRGEPDGTWVFLTNHACMLLLIHRDPDTRLTDLAERLEITERAAQRIIHDLVDGGYLVVCKQGRCNHYEIVSGAPMRHPIMRSAEIRQLLDILNEPPAT